MPGVTSFRPGMRLRLKDYPDKVYVVYACTCRSYVLWPMLEGGRLDNGKNAILVPFSLAHRRYEVDAPA